MVISGDYKKKKLRRGREKYIAKIDVCILSSINSLYVQMFTYTKRYHAAKFVVLCTKWLPIYILFFLPRLFYTLLRKT